VVDILAAPMNRPDERQWLESEQAPRRLWAPERRTVSELPPAASA
jgi:hypothetical protein